MKKITLTALMLFTALGYAQVGINTNNPDASSALEIESTTGGILIPRLTQTQRDAIDAPATGLMIYQTNQTAGFYFYDGAAWTKINGADDTTLQSNIDAVQDDVDQNELDADASIAAVNIMALNAQMEANYASMEAYTAQNMAMDASMEANYASMEAYTAQNMAMDASMEAYTAQMEANMAQSTAMDAPNGSKYGSKHGNGCSKHGNAKYGSNYGSKIRQRCCRCCLAIRYRCLAISYKWY